MSPTQFDTPHRGFGNKIPAILSLAGILLLASCGNSTNPLPAATTAGGGGTTSAPTGTTSSGLAFGCAYSSRVPTDVICVTVSTSSQNIAADGSSTATITANLTLNGSPYGGQVVNFALSSSGYGTLVNGSQQATALSSAAGVATTTFTAGAAVGAVQVNVSYDAASTYVALGLTSPGGTTAPPPTALSPGCGNSTTPPTTDVICLTLATSTTSLTADGTSQAVLSATLTKNGNPFPNQVVDFTLGSTTYGTLVAATGLTNASGVATSAFKAGTTLGAVQLSAHFTTANATVALGLVASASTSAAGGIQFVSASPASIGVQGSGLQTTSSVVFKVTDATGAAIAGTTVNFSMVGPGGGTYIGPTPGSLTATGTTDTSGNVAVTLNSGNVAGTATITATVTAGGLTFSVPSSVLSIGGAVPSARHFSLASERLNLPGLTVTGFETNVSVYAADRFSNSAVLQGTQVSFYTEAGAIAPNVALDSTGMGTVKFRTQDPKPMDVDGVAPFPGFSQNPPDGHVTVIAVVRGEESFVDANGNGIYDSGESFTDLGEPYIDANDNGVWDGPGCTTKTPLALQAACDPTLPAEFYVDTNGNGAYDGPNGLWDGPNCAGGGCNTSPNIWTRHTLMFTGNLVCDITLSSGASADNFDILNNSFEDFTYFISDGNGNWPVPGTQITITVAGAGTAVTGVVSAVVSDAVSSGAYTGKLRISDADAATNANNSGSITVTATPPSGEAGSCVPTTVFGTVH